MKWLLLQQVQTLGSAPRGGDFSKARASGLSIATAVALQLHFAGRASGENHTDLKYENYQETGGRISVQTEAFLFEQSLSSHLTLQGEYTHDAVSGASPTGAPPPPGSSQVPLKHMEDERNAGMLEGILHFGRNTATPQFSYSLESDYQSIGGSLADAIDFNQKNTTVSFGYAHSYDTIFPKFWGNVHQHKNSDDFLLGVTQLLSPRAFVTANLTYGTASGYLADPYKGVRFDGYPDPNSLFPEKRPGHKTKEIGYLSANYFIDPLEAGAELGYRLYHDSFGIYSHTVSLAWHQKLGKYVVLSPLFRFTEQTAAYFYATRFPGDPSDPYSPIKTPAVYSADYRLSALQTFTYGVTATVMIKSRLYLDLAYMRYEMYGTDGVTSASAYPKANVFTAGLRLWF